MRNRLAGLILCTVAYACGDAAGPQAPAGSISILTDQTQYELVQSVTVYTTNRSGRLLYDDHCGGAVEGFEYLEEWNASFGMARGCMGLDSHDWRSRSIAIPGGGTNIDTFYVNDQAYTGTWRVRLYLRDEAGGVLPEAQSASNAFRVDGRWSP